MLDATRESRVGTSVDIDLAAIPQDERAAFLDDLYGTMFVDDKRRYFRAGGTFKF